MSTFIVKSHIRHDGVHYEEGQGIDLTDAQAEEVSHALESEETAAGASQKYDRAKKQAAEKKAEAAEQARKRAQAAAAAKKAEAAATAAALAKAVADSK